MSDPAETGDRPPFWNRRKIQIGLTVLIVFVVGVLLATSRGCRRSSRVSRGTAQDTAEKEAAQRSQLFDIAWGGLQRPEVFDGMFESDEEIGRAMDRLDQWLQAQKPLDDRRVDPLVAPLAESLGSFVQYVKPVDAALTRPGYVLELKDIARRFETPAARLESLAQRRSLRELDQLARRYEESLKEIDRVAGQIADALRESRESDRDPARVRPRTGTGAGDAESDLHRYEAQFLQRLFDRVRDPSRQATFNELYELARQLDYPGRLREAKSLAALAQALEEFAAKHRRSELEALVAQYEDVVSRYAEVAKQTRLSLQLRFIANELDNAASMKDLAEWKALDQIVGEAAERLKIAAKRTDRSELGDLAAQVDEARNKRDISAVNGLAAQLAAKVRPATLADLKDSAPQLRNGAEMLAQLAGRIGQLATQNQSENLQGLSEYVGRLAAELQFAAQTLENSPQTTDPRKPAGELELFSLRFAVLTARVKRLAEDLDYFATLGALHFLPADRSAVREAILVRDVSRWARGEEADDVSRAKRLFDWVVRNIQLEPDKEPRSDRAAPRFLKRPWETLIRGAGTAMERAWVFILLARQQGLDAAVLALEDPADPARRPLRPWAVAVLSEGNIHPRALGRSVVASASSALWPVPTAGCGLSDLTESYSNLYLFDPYLGLPIPGPGGVKLDESGQLDVWPATLAQVLGDERLLHQMDLDQLSPYRVKASELRKIVALVERSPAYLAERMRIVESRLAKEDHAVLSVGPTAKAEWLKSCVGLADVRLWPLPYEAWFQRTQTGDDAFRQAGAFLQLIASGALWKGRVRHLEGKFTGESNAVQFYGKARLSDREIESLSGAVRQQESRSVKPGSQRDAELVAASIASLKAIAVLARQNASYWLGLAAFEQGKDDQRKYEMAIDYLATRTLEAYPDGPWTPGAKYNLGRVYEAQKNYPQAIQQYRGNTGSAQSYGDQLRAQWLEKRTVPELPGLPGLPKEKEGSKKERPSKPGPSEKEKPGAGELPKLPGLREEKAPPKAVEKAPSR